MVITEEFLKSEIEDIQRESEKARVFLIQAEATIRAYTVLIGKIQTGDQTCDQCNSDPLAP